MTQDKQKPGSNEAGTDKGSQVQGEGNYEAARRYEDKLRDHVQHHDVEREARDAEPKSEGEEREMEQAEELGKQRAKEEDALLNHPEGIDREPGAKDKSRP